MYICINHINDKSLMALAIRNGNQHLCDICKVNEIAIDANDRDIHTMLKSIVRYNYDEVEYNDHYGGEHSFLSMIIEMKVFDGLLYDSPHLETLDSDFSDLDVYDNHGVSIHAGYYNGQQNLLLRAIKNDPFNDFMNIESEIKTKNYHEFESYLSDILDNYKNSFSTSFDTNDILYRARRGVSSIRHAYGDFGRDHLYYKPYQGDDISSVPVIKAEAGRANRVGVSYLYCATDEYTAISEIRPHPGDVVSLGSFKARKKLKIFDLTGPNILNYYQSDSRLDELKDYAAISYFFNKSTPPSVEGRYLVTQLIAEGIRRKGYDGIVFISTVGEGKNYVFFNPEDMIYIPSSMKTCEIKEVKYDYKECLLEGVDDKYATYRDMTH